MSKERQDAVPARRWSLRREWSRAFALLLSTLLVVGVGAIVGVHAVVHEVQGTARQLHRESVTVARLQSDLIDHEQAGHRLLSAESVDRTAFLRQQDAITAEFTAAAKVFPTTYGMRATVLACAASWRTGLEKYHLWGSAATTLRGDHSADNPTFGAASDATDGLLDGLEAPSLAVMNTGLARGSLLERLLIVALTAVFGLAMALTWYFRRRMNRDLVQPVARLLDGVLTLRQGAYETRLTVARPDEIGELTEAFNGMAEALQEGHLTLSHRASHDSLTGLANRAALGERLDAAFGPATERRSRRESLLFIDIDDFKDVNDGVGHAGGDTLLILLAEQLRSCVRPYDLVARLGGDEFAIVVVEDQDAYVAVQVAERVLASLRNPFLVDGAELVVAVSIGIAHCRPETCDATELLRDADFAMYTAKRSGKNRFHVYEPGAYRVGT